MRIKKQQDDVESPDMTPMLDVVFIMLIFFIVSTSFVKEEGVDWLTLTKSKSSTTPIEEVPLVLSINEFGKVSIGEREIQLDAVLANVQAERAKNNHKTAIVRAHARSSTMSLVRTVDQIKLAGIDQVSVGAYRSE
ncbi:MAG: biopolymer transporter ExbD [Kangiellaceae bacterium]|nr:biopolymer transporter ExbD [Kangiellaceae bacterium]MCW8998025.1 biopolymer transporter ExbD [Kangiellaceae bacterium]